MATALIVVDCQVDFCEGGALGVDGGNDVVEAIADLLETDHGYDFVVATRDHHIKPGDHFSDEPDFIDSWPPHCVVGTDGQQFHETLQGYDFDAIFDKGSYEAAYSGFEGTIGAEDDGVGLAQWLGEQGVTKVDVVGIATDFCVRATSIDAAQEGFETTVLSGLTAAVRPDNIPAVAEEVAEERVTWA